MLSGGMAIYVMPYPRNELNNNELLALTHASQLYDYPTIVMPFREDVFFYFYQTKNPFQDLT